MSVQPFPVTSKGQTRTIDPLPEPRATLDAAERVMVATSALLRNLERDPDMHPKTLQRWGSLMQQSHDDLQRNALALARLSSEGARS